jgi:hypothetical protein
MPLFKAGDTSDAGYLRPRKRTLPDVFASQAAWLTLSLSPASFYLALEDRAYEVTLVDLTLDGTDLIHTFPDHRRAVISRIAALVSNVRNRRRHVLLSRP